MSNTIHKAMPLLLTILGAALFFSLAVWKAFSFGLTLGGLLFSVTIIIYVLWMVWESRVSVGELEKDNVTGDKNTMEFAAAAKMTLLFVAIVFSSAPSTETALPGILIMSIGILIRTRAISLLGSRYSHRIRKPVLPLEENGIYRYIRHPAYFGTWLIHLGFVLVLHNNWSILALLLLWLPAVVMRTIVEERYLTQFPEYSSYALRVRSRFIPYVW